MTKNIGLDVKAPDKECNDVNCPFHGNLPVRGQVFTGLVISNKMGATVVVKRTFEKLVTKYERYQKRQSKLHAHNPSCIDAKEGDIVKVAECRPLSKTKTFVVVEVV